MKTLKELFLDEVADMYDAEQRIVKALPKMAKAATSDELKEAFQSHLKESEGHVKKLTQVFQAFDEKAKGKTCEATVGLLEEGDEIAAEFKGSPAINAALISAMQKVEHYEIASYGCLHEWAEVLGNKEAAGLLKQILDEEKAANESLNELAHSSLNQEALYERGAYGPSEEDEKDEKMSEKSTAKDASWPKFPDNNQPVAGHNKHQINQPQEKNMTEENSPPRSGIKLFAVGALIGAAIALLYAPQSGKETRKLLAKKAKLLKDKAQETVEHAQEFIKDRKADVAAVFDSGKELADQAKHKRS